MKVNRLAAELMILNNWLETLVIFYEHKNSVEMIIFLEKLLQYLGQRHHAFDFFIVCKLY